MLYIPIIEVSNGDIKERIVVAELFIEDSGGTKNTGKYRYTVHIHNQYNDNIKAQNYCGVIEKPVRFGSTAILELVKSTLLQIIQ